MEDKYTKIIDKLSKALGSKISKGFALDNKVYVSIEKVYDANSRGTESGICGYGETYEEACHNYLDMLCDAKNPVGKGCITIDTSGFEEFREKETDKVDAIEKAVSELKYLLGLGVDVKCNRDTNYDSIIPGCVYKLECTPSGSLYVEAKGIYSNTVMYLSPGQYYGLVSSVMQGEVQFIFCSEFDEILIRAHISTIQELCRKKMLDVLSNGIFDKTVNGMSPAEYCDIEAANEFDRWCEIKVKNDSKLKRFLSTHPIHVKWVGLNKGNNYYMDIDNDTEYILLPSDTSNFKITYFGKWGEQVFLELNLNHFIGIHSTELLTSNKNKPVTAEFHFCNEKDEKAIREILNSGYTTKRRI